MKKEIILETTENRAQFLILIDWMREKRYSQKEIFEVVGHVVCRPFLEKGVVEKVGSKRILEVFEVVGLGACKLLSTNKKLDQDVLKILFQMSCRALLVPKELSQAPALLGRTHKKARSLPGLNPSGSCFQADSLMKCANTGRLFYIAQRFCDDLERLTEIKPSVLKLRETLNDLLSVNTQDWKARLAKHSRVNGLYFLEYEGCCIALERSGRSPKHYVLAGIAPKASLERLTDELIRNTSREWLDRQMLLLCKVNPQIKPLWQHHGSRAVQV